MGTCPRCGDFMAEAERVLLWNEEEFCTGCVERAGGPGFLARMRAEPQIEIRYDTIRGRLSYTALMLLVPIVIATAIAAAWGPGSLLVPFLVVIGLFGLVFTVYAIGAQTVSFGAGSVETRTLGRPRRRLGSAEVIRWHVLTGRSSLLHITSDSFVKVQARDARRPTVIRLWGEPHRLADLRASLLLIAPERELEGKLGQVFPDLA